MSDNAFHEKAGLSQEVFLLPSRHCRHPSIRSHWCAFRSLQVGRSRFSRCCHLFGDLDSSRKTKLGQALCAVTGTRRLASVSFL